MSYVLRTRTIQDRAGIFWFTVEIRCDGNVVYSGVCCRSLDDVLAIAAIHSAQIIMEETTPSQAADTVNHPSHYTSHPSGVECIRVVEHMTFNIGNAVKYLWRADLKGERLENLKKAAWYINREIEKIGKQKAS